jgi:hypothetical protein
MIVEPFANDQLKDNLNPVGRGKKPARPPRCSLPLLRSIRLGGGQAQENLR